MKHLFILFITTLLVENSHCQLYIPDYGKIDDNELLMTRYDNDPEADAVVLYDIGKSEFEESALGNYFIRFTRKTRIKILTKEGISASIIEIPLYKEHEKNKEELLKIEGNTYNLTNGTKTIRPIDKSKIFEEIINDNWSVKKIAMPDVRIGSVIEYSYTLDIPFIFNLPDWRFQSSIPTVYSEYTVSMIPTFEYIYLLKGADKFDFQNSFIEKSPVRKYRESNAIDRITGQNVIIKVMVHNYVMKNIPAFKDEGYLYNKKDHIVTIDFQLVKINSSSGMTRNIMSTWLELSSDLLKNDNFGDYIKGAKNQAKKILETELIIASQSETEKLKTIIQYIKENFTWDGFNGIYADKSAKDFFKTKIGNAANINLFLLALLREAGFDAQPVILSTRRHGKIHLDYPFINSFNYVAVLVNSTKPFLTDGTNQYLPYNRIPLQCQHESGLIVNDKNEWVTLENKILSDITYLINMQIDVEKNILQLRLDIICTEFEAQKLKSLFKDDTLAIKEHFEKANFKGISQLGTKNFAVIGKPYSISFTCYTDPDYLGDSYILNPFNHLHPKENSLKQKTRNYPIDFEFPKSEKYQIKINIPQGYKIDSTPEDYIVSDDLAEIKIKYKIDESTLSITGNYIIKKQRYQPNEYSTIKSYLDILATKLNDQLVLVKN